MEPAFSLGGAHRIQVRKQTLIEDSLGRSAPRLFWAARKCLRQFQKLLLPILERKTTAVSKRLKDFVPWIRTQEEDEEAAAAASGGGGKKKKKKKKKKGKAAGLEGVSFAPGSHRDSVLGLAWNPVRRFPCCLSKLS